MINKIIRNFIAKQMAGRSDDGIMITLKDPKKVTFAENIMADLLMRNGIDPRAITSEQQLKNILQQIENAQAAAIRNTGIRNTKSAKIFDLEGKEIPKGSKIMGGKELKFDSDQPPPGSRGGEDDIAAPVMNVEDVSEDFMNFVNRTDPKAAAKLKKMNDEIKAKIEAGNKRYLDKIKKQKEEGTYKRYNPEEGSPLDLEIKEEYQKAIRGESKLFAGKFEGTEDDFRNMLDEMTDDFAKGGRVGLKVGTGLRFLQRVFGKQGLEDMKDRDPEMYIGLLEVVDMYRKRDKEGLKMYLQKFLPHMDDAEIEAFIIGSDGSEGLIGELIRLGSGRDYAGKLEMIKKSEEMKKLRDLEVTEDMLRKPNADGGIMRLGFKDGMNRRTFLKLFTGLVSIPIIGKIVKPFKIGKKVTQVPIIKTGDVPGKPEWFDQLVNKVILEGDEVTKRFATQERQVVHMKKIDDETTVMVTQDLNDGSIMVDVDDPIRNVMGESGQETSVQMMLKKNPGDESNPATADEFSFTENDMRNYMDGPDDYTTEFTENTVRKMKDLTSDLGKIKSYATGKKQTMKEFIESKKRKDMVKFAEDNPAEYAAGRGPEVDYDPEPDFAKGGIARMLGE